MQALRIMALFEGSSLLLLLFIAVPLKHFYDLPQAVTLVGPIHGMLFLAFNVMLMLYSSRGAISHQQASLGVLASFIPFGSFIYKAKVLRQLSNKN